MKFSKKLCALTALVAGFVCPENIFSATVPIETALTALLGQHYSDETAKVVKKSVGQFMSNQNYVAANFKKVLEEHISAIIVEAFDIPESDMQHIKEKLSPFTLQPVFYRRHDDDPVPQMQAFKALEVIGFGMNRAAEKAFLNDGQSDLDASQGKDFNRAQMEVIVEHECCHIKNGDGDLKVLCMVLNKNKGHFSDAEFSQILGAAFGQDFLDSRTVLTDAITRDAQKMGIHDFSTVDNFGMDLMAFQRYYETRVDKYILDSRDKKKIEAYKTYYQNKNDSPTAKDKEIKEQRAIKTLLGRGLAIPLEYADFGWPTDQERVEACDKALAKLEEQLEVFMIKRFQKCK